MEHCDVKGRRWLARGEASSCGRSGQRGYIRREAGRAGSSRPAPTVASHPPNTHNMKVLLMLCLVGVTVCAPQNLRNEEIIIIPEPYEFNLNVADDESTNYQSRAESQDSNGVVRGQYSWVGPNGIRYTTTYTADADSGFQAHTVEEQTDIVVKIPVHRPQEQQRV